MCRRSCRAFSTPLTRARAGVLASLALRVAAALAVPALAVAAGATSTTAPTTATAASATMTAVRFHEYGDASQLRLERAPRPVPRAGQVLVRVRAASVNPYDWKFREGRLRAYVPATLPFTPGIDFAGVVEAVGQAGAATAPAAGGGAAAPSWQRGDEVYGFVAGAAPGAYAQYVVAEPANLARKPASMSFEEAAAIPVAALTAWKALYDFGGLEPQGARGRRLLVNGASGSVGLATIQLAKLAGLQVVAVASARNQALMRRYGADATLDYRSQKVEPAVVPPVDLAIDTVDLATAAASARVVRPGGVLVAMNVTPKPPEVPACSGAPPGLRCVQVPNFQPRPGVFQQVAARVADGRLRMEVGAVLPLADAAKAQELSRRGGTPGKIVLRVD
ncbi:MAG: NADP-dependent oxidoreductase [Steroidobacteraceae bacterium]|jgi:NADPH:quinone reductase-like Zn-dependent oxidoreductase|nr:NADP-dependent oxidoreductase [Steroidobacteraceae bacterium]